MNLETYNKRLIAIVGTIIALAVGVFLLVGLFILVKEISRSSPGTDNSLSVETNNQGNNNIIKKQDLTFLEPRLIDSSRNIYLIPVSQVNVEKEEILNKDGSSYDSDETSFGYSSRKNSYYRYSGFYNNMILYYLPQQIKTVVFKKKVNINEFENTFIKDVPFLILKGTTKDTNGDRKLNNEDLQSFFVYNIMTKELNEVQQKEMGLVDYHILYNTNEALLRFGKDLNKDGSFNEEDEPIFLKRYLVNENKLLDFVDEEVIQNLQLLINKN